MHITKEGRKQTLFVINVYDIILNIKMNVMLCNHNVEGQGNRLLEV